jgi:light-regulated signal transduction histidine kinase (bacteriophytochrome)
MDDVTERIRAEQAAAERTGELERFTMVASHDLQEPLRKIRTFGALLVDECAAGLDETGRDYVTRMSAAAGRMQTLIDDLLTLARATTRASRMTRLDLGTVVQDVLIDLEVAMRESGAVVNVSELPTVDADPVEMRQLFLNLLSNALKFRRDDVAPVVTITSRNLEGVRPTIEIAVQDNGIGFDPRHAELVFQPFQRLHGRHEFAGNGIGLALCRRIVERHGGSIQARSVAGESTTFLFTIPIGEARRILPALPTTQQEP